MLILKIGIGNWKIETIRYDAKNLVGYRVPNHAHNDFLQVAAESGLQIPKTLISNQTEEIRSFFDEVNGQMIAKLQQSLSFSMGRSGQFFPTTKIEIEHLEQMEDTLKYCPMMFQEYVPKSYELRIAYVDGKYFTGKISTNRTSSGQTDWRNTEMQGAEWEAYDLPQKEQAALQAFMENLGLVTGGIDMIRKPTGEYVFLEVNPSGEWGMLQHKLGFPIAEQIGEAILRRISNEE